MWWTGLGTPPSHTSAQPLYLPSITHLLTVWTVSSCKRDLIFPFLSPIYVCLFFSTIIFATITISVSIVMAVIVPAWPCFDWACNNILGIGLLGGASGTILRLMSTAQMHALVSWWRERPVTWFTASAVYFGSFGCCICLQFQLIGHEIRYGPLWAIICATLPFGVIGLLSILIELYPTTITSTYAVVLCRGTEKCKF